MIETNVFAIRRKSDGAWLIRGGYWGPKFDTGRPRLYTGINHARCSWTNLIGRGIYQYGHPRFKKMTDDEIEIVELKVVETEKVHQARKDVE